MVIFKQTGATSNITVNGYVVTNGVRTRIFFVKLNSDVFPESKTAELIHPFFIEAGSYLHFEGVSDTNNSEIRFATASTIETI